MRDGNSNKSKLSWSKTLVKKWFSVKNKARDSDPDDAIHQAGDEDWRKNVSEKEACTISESRIERPNRRNSVRFRERKIGLDASQVTNVHNYSIFVATWNVAGKSPPSYLNLKDWLHSSPAADIYVLGFQEIVPLNAGNVLGTEDNGPAGKWVTLIQKILDIVPDSIVGLNADFEGSTRRNASSIFHDSSFQSVSHSMRMMENNTLMPQPRLERRFSVCDGVFISHKPSDYDPNVSGDFSSDDENEPGDFSPDTTHYLPVSQNCSIFMEEGDGYLGQSRYCLVASKQMVGIFLTVWVKTDLRHVVHNMKISCVGTGLMGYLGNKGSISISMSLHQTSFCFVCSHLTSGQKDGDELRRNSDVAEILRKTRFPRAQSMEGENSPRTILEHDRIIWLGDLNYRIALSYHCAKALVDMRNWRTLLENDQLRIEQRQGHVFEGWSEGKIYFPPTYKYLKNSDKYAGDDINPKAKRRTPSWCDRILWYGIGLHQISYARGESRFSDHRPVYSTFLAEVESISFSRNKRSLNCSSSRIEVEELLPHLD
ncbi:type IV inositol polyphosphate 5-phosphatase 7-like [Diospyros lotus]|uniref:type IV inositol polyphosphate 5-phosphatase 7-like n=1 Tax=Diospyros lotus TaxID=55363 RepID=UPI0022558CDD|nr:type IV inositol polyphosphate 5-phosphatase 7-like [Diospyros lotus]